MSRQRISNRYGFTLIELLVVITIIGIVAGISIPAIMAGRISVMRSTIKMDINAIAGAIDQYRNKYNDYPPDGSSWTVFERHIRKAFPDIEQSELDLMNPANRSQQSTWLFPTRNDSEFAGLNMNAADLRVMEPAEAIVFFLGGFSDNPRKPFTGSGGPFLGAIGGNGYQYNPGRKNAFFEFEASRLTLAVSGSNTVSNDEALFALPDAQANSQVLNDCLPMYLGRYGKIPVVYFDHRTYAMRKGGSYFYNRFRIGNGDTIRPLKSDTALTTGGAGGGDPLDKRFKYMEDQKFQLICAGLDDVYGAYPAGLPFEQPILHRFPSGDSDVANTSFKGFAFVTGTLLSPQRDNTANFSDATFEIGLPK